MAWSRPEAPGSRAATSSAKIVELKRRETERRRVIRTGIAYIAFATASS